MRAASLVLAPARRARTPTRARSRRRARTAASVPGRLRLARTARSHPYHAFRVTLALTHICPGLSAPVRARTGARGPARAPRQSEPTYIRRFESKFETPQRPPEPSGRRVSGLLRLSPGVAESARHSGSHVRGLLPARLAVGGRRQARRGVRALPVSGRHCWMLRLARA